MTSWLIWAAVLMAQAGSSTWASRARNTGSLRYHAVAAVFSHGVWFASLYTIMDKTKAADGLEQILFVGAFYTFFCVLGSVGAHAATQRYLERGARRVGAER